MATNKDSKNCSLVLNRGSAKYNNAMAETVNRRYKAEVIWRRGPLQGLETIEHTTLEWVDWFNNRRLLEHRWLLN